MLTLPAQEVHLRVTWGVAQAAAPDEAGKGSQEPERWDDLQLVQQYLHMKDGHNQSNGLFSGEG